MRPNVKGSPCAGRPARVTLRGRPTRAALTFGDALPVLASIEAARAVVGVEAAARVAVLGFERWFFDCARFRAPRFAQLTRSEAELRIRIVRNFIAVRRDWRQRH